MGFLSPSRLGPSYSMKEPSRKRRLLEAHLNHHQTLTSPIWKQSEGSSDGGFAATGLKPIGAHQSGYKSLSYLLMRLQLKLRAKIPLSQLMGSLLNTKKRRSWRVPGHLHSELSRATDTRSIQAASIQEGQHKDMLETRTSEMESSAIDFVLYGYLY